MRSKRNLFRLLGLAMASTLALAGGLSGCDAGSQTPIACAGDDRCPPPSNNFPWAVQLSPSSSNTTAEPLMAQDQSRVSWSGDGAAVLQFRAVTQLSGEVLDAAGRAVGGARVTARLASLIPGQNDYSLGTLTTDSDTDAGRWGFHVPLPQDPSTQPYRVWVGFDSANKASLSPPTWRDALILTELGPNIGLNLQLRPQAELAVVTGKILSPLGEGIGNLSVQVFDASGQVVSSTGISDATLGLSAGSYRVVVDPTLNSAPTMPLTVVVRPGPNKVEMPILEATLQPPRAGSESRVDFAVPSHRAPLTFGLPIQGGGAGASSVPVAGARVRAIVSLADTLTTKLGIRAYYTAQADSNSEGIATLPLVPAPPVGSNLTYQLMISSPSHLPFASLPAAQLQVGPTNGRLGAIVLPLRAEVRGRLISSDGHPVAGVAVAATRITGGEVYASPYGSTITTADLPQATTDVDGQFALRVDPGDYDFEFLPMPGTGARSSLDNQRVKSDDVDLREIQLPEITQGSVLVLSPLGMPVEGAKVRIFQLPDTSMRPGTSCSTDLPCSRNAKLRAEAFTEANGTTQLLLPGGTARRLQ